MKASELADYSVGTVWHVQDRGRKIHLVDLVRGRFEYPELVAAALALWRKWKVEWAHTNLVIEDKGSGSSSTRFHKRSRSSPGVNLIGTASTHCRFDDIRTKSCSGIFSA
jgi:phage terminase large subunit-like protein